MPPNILGKCTNNFNHIYMEKKLWDIKYSASLWMNGQYMQRSIEESFESKVLDGIAKRTEPFNTNLCQGKGSHLS